MNTYLTATVDTLIPDGGIKRGPSCFPLLHPTFLHCHPQSYVCCHIFHLCVLNSYHIMLIITITVNSSSSGFATSTRASPLVMFVFYFFYVYDFYSFKAHYVYTSSASPSGIFRISVVLSHGFGAA